MWLVLFAMMNSLSWGALPHSDKNPLLSPLGNPYDNGYPEERYHQVLDHIIKIYTPLVKNEGGTFRIKRDWTDGAVNMWAERWGQDYILEVPGGMARYYLISEEGFILSICHEIGHLLGGPPQSRTISYEGQADYYATQTCMALVLADFERSERLVADNEVNEICAGNNFCERVLMGAKSLSSLYAELEKAPMPLFKTPSRQVVSKTLTKHPPAQCRLDTFLAGYQQRPRPACWYKE